ncbi:MAG: peptidylprolyl isomerase [Deltaproteobacteria bacterium]|nr:MAG: peptidylprolyl isomerase [Deltaproteobacteria bacterium]
MPILAQGSRVLIHFQGKLADGEVFESTYDQEPLLVCLGSHEILDTLEQTILSMTKGETQTVLVTPEEGYGAYREDRILTISKASMPPLGSIKPGQELILRTPEGEELPGIILDMTADAITLDANHPLAGEELEFTITLVDVIPPDRIDNEIPTLHT